MQCSPNYSIRNPCKNRRSMNHNAILPRVGEQKNLMRERRTPETHAAQPTPPQPHPVHSSPGSWLACPPACVVGTSHISFVLIGSASSSFMFVECGTDVPLSIVYVVLFFKPPQNRRPLRRQQCNLQRIARVAL